MGPYGLPAFFRAPSGRGICEEKGMENENSRIVTSGEYIALATSKPDAALSDTGVGGRLRRCGKIFGWRRGGLGLHIAG